MSDHGIKVGQVFKDNDPRMSRHVRIVEVHPNGATYRQCHDDGEFLAFDRHFTALAHRFYFDGKPRKSGFSFVCECHSGSVD